MRARVTKYIVNYIIDNKHGEVGDLIDSFLHPNGKIMYSLMFNDGELKGYYKDQLDPFLRIVK
ncbi:hypothetical protein [Paenibacillus sp. LK1]|uniref:hypothetical protein n=1 Tax=Paenibacillus sp. LK1 TaxID=2053014 RepID=UPI000C18F678|nr:hypothetical protein [Paenibacillus sp. LK1]PIH59004.1 hypothetical protein CS562_13750 [Paenibacillus sp. LK1]